MCLGSSCSGVQVNKGKIIVQWNPDFSNLQVKQDLVTLINREFEISVVKITVKQIPVYWETTFSSSHQDV